MCLVDDQRVVLRQQPVPLYLRQKDAVGHHLDEGRLTDSVGEANGVSNGGSYLDAEFVSQTFGDRPCGDASGLCVANESCDTPPGLEAELWQLRALARACLAGHDDHLMSSNRLDQIVVPFTDR